MTTEDKKMYSKYFQFKSRIVGAGAYYSNGHILITFSSEGLSFDIHPTHEETVALRDCLNELLEIVESDTWGGDNIL